MPPSSYKFGEFELDRARFELRREGRGLKLERIPLELLFLLAEKDGAVVTRQEIVDRLWGKDVFVDTDHGINTAIRKIRTALREDAENPRFVLTVPGKGYRFAGLSPNGDSQPAPILPPVQSEPESNPVAEATPRAVSVDPVRPSSGWNSSWRTAAAVLLMLVVACFVYLYWFARNWFARTPTAPPAHVMLAVLPFENLSNDPNEEYFTDGLTEEIIAQLGAASPEKLGVIARTTSMSYKRTAKSIQQIGSELGVDYILESSVRRDGSQLRITAQLIRTRDQVHIWAQSYDRQISGSIALQEEVAKAVAEQIEVKLSPDYASRPVRSHHDLQANEAYLRGRYFENQFTADGYRKAISYFQDAISRDPNFAEAYAGIADSYRFLVITDTISPAEGTPKIFDSAQKSVQLGDDLAESHNAMANAMMDQWAWDKCDEESKRAIALNPSYSNVHRIYAAVLAAQLRPKEAHEQINEAMRTDPLSMPNNAEVVRTFYYARDYDGALAEAKKGMQLSPDYYRIHFWMARVYGQKHMYKEAIEEAAIVLKANPDSNLALTEMAYALATGGREAEARKILQQLEARRKSAFVPAYNLAIIHTALKENDEALKSLQLAYDEHDWAILVLACEPRLDPLRTTEQFRNLIKKIGLPS